MTTSKIYTTNYFETIEEVGFENLPKALQESHMVILSNTNEGENWVKYKSDPEFKRMVNLAFRKLEELINSETDYPDNSQIKKFKTEYDFIKRFLGLHNTTKTHGELKSFLNKLIECIKQKKIRKTSLVANEIMFIQKALIAKSKGMASSKIKLALKNSTIQTMEDALQLIIEQNIQMGTKTTIKNTDNKNLDGLTETEPKPESSVNLMKSTDFSNLQFNTIGFKDKWLGFIGDPAPDFTAMVYGMPKMGKSYLCVDFAGYLARNHGMVLYVAKEEKLDKTLQDKLNEKNVAHENLIVADGIPDNLMPYDFIFLDSVNKLGLSPQDLEKLKHENKGKSFIFIFQATKDGKFKGNNEFQHDVDVVIEVPEIGKAVQFGRYNQGGELNIFQESNKDLTYIKNVPKLEGINSNNMKKSKVSIPAWTEPKHLNPKDHADLWMVYKLYQDRNFDAAFKFASGLETIVREEIPLKIWKEIGRKLTRLGEDRLIQLNHNDRPDGSNPRFIFSNTSTQLLAEALKGEFDLKQLVRDELANRGLDKEGKWVGFEKAAIIYKIKK